MNDPRGFLQFKRRKQKHGNGSHQDLASTSNVRKVRKREDDEQQDGARIEQIDDSSCMIFLTSLTRDALAG